VPRILVVDDQAINVQLLRLKLEREGMQVLTAPSGREALAQANNARPDLILMDLLMPDMDGLTACRQLKADPATRDIPVIFLTASPSKEHRQEGRAAGAADYLVKPIDLDETMARVRLHLRLARLERETAELAPRLDETRRGALVGAAAQGVTHHLNNLLGVVLGYLDLIKNNANKPDTVRTNADNLEGAVQRIVGIIRQLTSLVVKSRLPTVPCALDELLNGALRRFRAEQRHQQEVVVENPLGPVLIHTHMEMFEDTLGKILTNALESYGEAHEGPRPITVRASLVEATGQEGRILAIRVEDRGRGIDPQLRDHMFEPFISSKNTVGVGMGLTVARHALRNMGGDLVLDDRPGGGAVALLTHPVERRRRAAG
jgi:CheY-like chemotaxis protein